MLNLKPILLVTGILLTVLATAMVIPALVDLSVDNPDWMTFAASAFITAFTGVSLVLTNLNYSTKITIREAFILTTTSWFVLSLFAAFPLWFSELDIRFTDAFFESMSALTTTGATVLVGLDDMPPGILLWRCLMQWLGGIGIIVIALAVLPMLRIGGMQLFRTESSDKSDKVMPRTAQISLSIGSVYLLFSVICAIMLASAGMSEFDAICHAMTTVATGGFSTRDASIGYFDNVRIEWIIMCFMILSSLPYVLYIHLVRGNIKPLLRDTQVQTFLGITVACILLMTSWLTFGQNMEMEEAFRIASFNITAIISSTGYSSADYWQWGSFAVTGFFLLSVVGGCTGSTSGGIKIFRFQILFQTARIQIDKLIHPHAVYRPRYNGTPIKDNVTTAVMSFVILFGMCFFILSSILAALGLDFITSISAAAATLANLGPALGNIAGPAGNFSTFPDSAKWILTVAMLIGRLEIFTVLVLLSPNFWRN